MARISVIIPTFNRKDFLRRAVDSVDDQTLKPDEIIIANDGEDVDIVQDDYIYIENMHRKNHPALSWYDAVYKASGDYIAFLLDDDWWEPRFLEKCSELMKDNVGYVFTEAMIRKSDGGSRKNLNFDFGGPSIYSFRMETILMRIPFTISPSCCLFRRECLLRDLIPTGIPGYVQRTKGGPAGPDLLMILMPLIFFSEVGYTGEPLVNLAAHDESTTINALKSRETTAELLADYGAARRYYLHVKAMLYPDHLEL
jgi:glycosyltransferase involved in cell wall biosynthesis